MRYKSLIFAAAYLLFGNNRVSAQFIVSGQSDCTQFGQLYSPPRVIYEYIVTGQEHELDVNGDGISDFLLVSDRNQGGNYYDLISYIKPLGQNEIAFGKADTICSGCNGASLQSTSNTLSVPRVFLPNDIIGSDQAWQKNLMYFEYSTKSGNCFNRITGLSYNGDKIIGTRIMRGNDTLYSWINFSKCSSNFMSIREFACEANRPLNISINPNPFTDYILVKLKAATLGTKWTLYDQFGQLVMNGTLDAVSTTIDLSGLSSAVYFFKTEYSTIKLIKIDK